MIRAAIFDRDGVLTYFDTEGAAAFYGALLPLTVEELGKRWQMWGMQVGFPTTMEEEETFFSGFWTALGQEYALDPGDIARLIDRPYTDFVVAYSDAAPMLAALKDRGLRVGVLSNFSLFSLEASLIAAGLAPYVDVAHAATIRGHAKPHHAAYESIAYALDVLPQDCFFVDDEEPCVTGAEEVGMLAFRLDRTRQSNAPAQQLLANLEDVETLLDFIGLHGQKAQ